MWHATFTQGNLGASSLIVVRITSDLAFGHNLCCRYPNGSCKPILDIYILKKNHWYKELFNSMNFDPCNYLLKIRESIGTSTPKMGAHLGVWGFIRSHFPALPRAWNVTPKLILGWHLYKPLPWSRAQG